MSVLDGVLLVSKVPQALPVSVVTPGGTRQFSVAPLGATALEGAHADSLSAHVKQVLLARRYLRSFSLDSYTRLPSPIAWVMLAYQTTVFNHGAVSGGFGVMWTPARDVSHATLSVTFQVDRVISGTDTATATLTGTLDYTPAPDQPTITPPLSPAIGVPAGGDFVTITGTNLTGTTGVTFGGAPATSVSVVDDTEVTCYTPPGSAGAVDVVLTTTAGSATDTGGFTYTNICANCAAYSGSPSATGAVGTLAAYFNQTYGGIGFTPESLTDVCNFGWTGETYAVPLFLSIDGDAGTYLMETLPYGAAGIFAPCFSLSASGADICAAGLSGTYVLPVTGYGMSKGLSGSLTVVFP